MPAPGVRGYEQLPLQEAVRNWLSYLDVAEDVQVIDVPQLGHTIRVLPLGLNRAVSLTHVGVGVSQILPVLVLCLLAEPETLILLEQPELHLHPATQQLLGEFLLAVSASGRQLIIETHSEHLVRRLLRSIAEDKTDRARELIGFVSSVRDRESTTTVYEPIQPNSYGGFDAWPHGFFDQGPEEAGRPSAQPWRNAQRRNRTNCFTCHSPSVLSSGLWNSPVGERGGENASTQQAVGAVSAQPGAWLTTRSSPCLSFR